MNKVAEVLQKFIDNGGYIFGQDVDPSGFGGMHRCTEGVTDPNHHIITMGVRENCAAHAAFGMVFATQGKTKVIVEAQFADFAALMTDAIWNCNALCKTYNVIPNVTLMTFRGPEEGSAEHSKSCYDIFGEMPGVVFMAGGFWGDQNECADRLEVCLRAPGVKVIEFDLIKDRNSGEPEEGYDEQTGKYMGMLKDIDSRMDHARGVDRIEKEVTLMDVVHEAEKSAVEEVVVKEMLDLHEEFKRGVQDSSTWNCEHCGSYNRPPLNFRTCAKCGWDRLTSPTPEENFSKEVLMLLDMLSFDKESPESIKLYRDTAKRLVAEMSDTFKKKDKSYFGLLAKTGFNIITFELLRKTNRIMQVVLKGQKDENPESLEENLKDIAVTATALAVKLKTGMVEDKVFEEMQKYFESDNHEELICEAPHRCCHNYNRWGHCTNCGKYADDPTTPTTEKNKPNVSSEV
jgi:hypothetical protein